MIPKIMTNKACLEAVFKGNIPDYPPHFELEFNLETEMFGMDTNTIEDKNYSSQQQLADAVGKRHIEVQTRLIEKIGYAAVPGLFYDERVEPIGAITDIRKALGDKALVFSYSEKVVYWMPTGSDIMDFVIMLFERPKEMHENARKKCQAGKELARQQVDAGVDFIVQNTDFGFNDGPFISPKHFQEFITPYMTEFVDYVHQLGVPVILHSDGDLNELLDQIYSTGVDGYQSVDPQGNMDIKLVREKFPDWILMGNVNCSMLQDVNEQEIRQSVKYCMDYGGVGKRYIFSTSNTIFKGMPPESYSIMLDAYQKIIEKHILS